MEHEQAGNRPRNHDITNAVINNNYYCRELLAREIKCIMHSASSTATAVQVYA